MTEDPSAVTLEVGQHDDEAEPEGPAQGRSIGRYVLIDKRGSGGLGVVYAAFDPKLDRKVAVKVLRRRWANKPVAAARFEREGKAMARVQHPNVVQVFDVGTDQDGGFIAMEFVDGITLRRWQNEGDRSWREIVAMYCGAARGLQAAHDAGLVHRDFKPDNVLVDEAGVPRVLDAETLALQWSFELPDGAWPTPVVVSLPEQHVGLALGLQHGDLVMFDTHERAMTWGIKIGDRHRRAPVLAQLREDGAPALVVVAVGRGPALVALDVGTGEVLWRTEGVGSSGTGPAVADLDGDGKDDVVVGTARGLAAVRSDGSLLWRADRAPKAGSAHTEVTLSDLDGDGDLEAISGFADGFVWVVDAKTGRAVWQFDVGGRVEAKPLALDVDADGVQEVIVGGWERYLYCLNHLPGRSQPAPR